MRNAVIKSSKMSSLDMLQNQNGISSRFSSQNSSQIFFLLNFHPVTSTRGANGRTAVASEEAEATGARANGISLMNV